jgi:hypothetical protein
MRSSFVQDGRLPAHEGPIQLSSSASGSQLMAGAELKWNATDRVRLQGYYRWLDVLTGDDHFTAAWASTPAHRFVHRVTWSPRPDLRLGWRIEGRSATTWSAYGRMGRARLPGSVISDLSVEKSLWDGRANLCARLSDVTDQERPLHPLGAAPGLSLAICGSVRVGG